jgi:hypothetical protein
VAPLHFSARKRMRPRRYSAYYRPASEIGDQFLAGACHGAHRQPGPPCFDFEL